MAGEKVVSRQSAEGGPALGRSDLYRRSSDDLPDVSGEDGSPFPSWKRAAAKYGHPVHRMMARLGSFPPALARYLILGYSSPGDVVLDPFCGKGTTLVEALLLGRRSIGSDAAPDAIAVTRAKISGVRLEDIQRYIDRLAKTVDPQGGDLRTGAPSDVRLFYHPRTLAELLAVRDALLVAARGSKAARFLLGCLLGILHGKSSVSLSVPSAHAYGMAPRYVRKYMREHGLRAPRRQVLQCLLAKASSCISNDEVPAGEARAYISSAENYRFERYGSLDEMVDLVVTSPPYLDAQTYAKDAWLRLWLLGKDYRDVRRKLIETGSVEVYRKRTSPCLRQMLRVLKPGGHAFLVAGDARTVIDGRPVLARTAEILADVAEQVDGGSFKFQVSEIIDDYVVPHSRYLFPVHSNGAGTSLKPKQERVLHLVKVRGSRKVVGR